MVDPTRGLSGFVAELKRRHVFRTFLAYVAAAFVVLQTAEIVLPAFDVGDWVLQLTVVLAVLGLPVVLALAWVYEITPGGIRTMRQIDADGGRRPEEASLLPRLALLAVTLLATGGAAAYWIRTSVPGVEAGTVDPSAASASPAFQPADRGARDVPIRSLAVLPLQSYAPPSAGEAGAAEGEYFAAGMHEALIGQLSRLGSAFRVISRTTVQQYDPAGGSVARIGRDLGVEGIVEGSVVLDGDRVRITVKLIHAPSDTHLWSEDYERELEDVIALQRDVATAIARAITGELDDEFPRDIAVADAAPAPEADPEAAMAEMKGRVVLLDADEGDEAAVEQALLHFGAALEEDSAYAPALVGFAGSTLMRELSAGVPSPEVLEEVREHVEKAVKIDPRNPEARDLSRVLGQMAPHVPGTGRPPVPPVTTDLGARIVVMSHRSEHTAAARDAQLEAVRTLRAVGRTEQAAGVLEGLVRRFPDFEPAWRELEHLLVAAGRPEEVPELRERRRTAGASAALEGGPTLEALARAVEEDGVRGYWTWRREEIAALRRAGREVPRLDEATGLAVLGERERALEALRKAADEGADLRPLRHDPTWDPFRRDPVFLDILRKAIGRGPDLPRGHPREAGLRPLG